ncbi:hypothetical protein CF319_g7191 [Tilletia indica]|nr:hypothetical protein CF319_g7191 [Tilletia indica]
MPALLPHADGGSGRVPSGEEARNPSSGDDGDGWGPAGLFPLATLDISVVRRTSSKAYWVTALREALNIQQYVGDLSGLNKIPARARTTGSKLETDPYDTLEVADPSQVQEVMDKVMSLGQADRSRCLKPVLFRTDSRQKRWNSQHIVDAFKEGARLLAHVQRRDEDAITSALTTQGLMDALTGKGPYTWVDVRDYPLDADLAEVAPALDEAFRRAVGWPGEAYFPGCGEVSRLASDISFRDAKAKLYASSATAEDVATHAHVDEAMASVWRLTYPHRIGAIQAADRQLAQARRSEILTLRSKVDLLEHQLSSLSRTGSAPGPFTASVAPTPPARHLTEEMRAEVAGIIP